MVFFSRVSSSVLLKRAPTVVGAVRARCRVTRALQITYIKTISERVKSTRFTTVSRAIVEIFRKDDILLIACCSVCTYGALKPRENPCGGGGTHRITVTMFTNSGVIIIVGHRQRSASRVRVDDVVEKPGRACSSPRDNNRIDRHRGRRLPGRKYFDKKKIDNTKTLLTNGRQTV